MSVGDVKRIDTGKSVDGRPVVGDAPNGMTDIAGANEFKYWWPNRCICDGLAGSFVALECKQDQSSLGTERDHMRRSVGNLVGTRSLVFLYRTVFVFGDRTARNHAGLRVSVGLKPVDIDRWISVANEIAACDKLFQVAFGGRKSLSGIRFDRSVKIGLGPRYAEKTLRVCLHKVASLCLISDVIRKTSDILGVRTVRMQCLKRLDKNHLLSSPCPIDIRSVDRRCCGSRRLF